MKHEGESIICVAERQVERQIFFAADDEAEFARVEISARVHIGKQDAEVVNARLFERRDFDNGLVHQRNLSPERVEDKDRVAYAFLTRCGLCGLAVERPHALNRLLYIFYLLR